MKRKISILMPYTTGNGGTETVVSNLFNEHNKKNFDLKLFIIGGTSNLEWLKHCNYVEKKMSNVKLIRTMQYVYLLPFIILKYIRNEKPDVIISTNPVMWTIAYFFTKRYFKNIKVISWYHYSLRQKPIRHFLLESADYYWSISTGIQNELIQRGIKRDVIFLMYNPIPMSKSLIPRVYGNTIYLVYIGRLMLDGQKNFRELILALSKVNVKWNLRVYGTGKQEECINFAKSLGIEENIKWKGFVSNPWEDIKKTDALVLTSKYEGLPMVLGEAMSHGVFCISSDCPTGPKDFIQNNELGILYKPGDYTELANAIEEFVGKKTNYSIIQKNSEEFSASKFYERVVNSLNHILN